MLRAYAKPEDEQQARIIMYDPIRRVLPEYLRSGRDPNVLERLNETLRDKGSPMPKDVRSAFFFAQNAMYYAYWYRPLITLALQQVLRVADLAARVAGEANGLKPHQNFGPRIAQLRAAGVVDTNHQHRWNLIVRMRNEAPHPEWQQPWGIPQTVDAVRMVAEEISALAWPGDDPSLGAGARGAGGRRV